MIDHYHAVQEVAYPGFGEGGCLIIYLYNHTHYLLTTPKINIIIIIIITVEIQAKALHNAAVL